MGKDAADAIPDSNERSAENDCLLDRLRSFSKSLEEPAGNGTLTRGEEQPGEEPLGEEPVGEAPVGEGASAEECGSIEEGESADRGSSASDARATKRRSAPAPSVGAGRSMFDMVEE